MLSAYEASVPDNSIVTSSVISAVEGNYGNYHIHYTKDRTRGSDLYISPLMSMYWAFVLDKVAERVLYLDSLEYTTSMSEIGAVIAAFRAKIEKIREAKIIPY